MANASSVLGRADAASSPLTTPAFSVERLGELSSDVLDGDDTFTLYLRAKGRAGAELAASGLDYTIVRPGSLTDDPGTGLVEIGEHLEGGSIGRDDVAAVMAKAVHARVTIGRTFDLVAGETRIDEALASL